jgi:hypothetical protein
MDEIRSHVISGYKSAPGRGAETGGALLGSFDPETREIVIESFEPIAIGHNAGPSYVLSDHDYEHWDAWVRALHQAGSPHLVGFCRGHTRPGLRVAPEDITLVERFFKDENGALLLIKPLSDRECVASFFPFVKGVVIDPATPSREFPFAPAERMSLAGQDPAAGPLRKRLSAWLPVTAVAAGIGLAALLHHMAESSQENPIASMPQSTVQQTSPSAASALLHLRSEPDGAAVKVEWDRDSPVLLGSAKVTMSVVDGGTRKEFPLSSTDREKGYVEWTPHAPETIFVMHVARPGAPPVIESLHVQKPRYPINSSSDIPEAKPPERLRASADTRGPVRIHRTAAARPTELAINSQNPGRLKRFVNGVALKASHLWPFRSAKQEPRTQ